MKRQETSVNEWTHCGLHQSEFKLTKLPRGNEHSADEFVVYRYNQQRKSPRKSEEAHKAEMKKMAEASLAKVEEQAMSISEPDFCLD